MDTANFSKPITDDEEEKSFNLPSRQARVVEVSPRARFVRFNEKLRTGTLNEQVYRAWDTLNGVEVSWNAISIKSFQGGSSGKRLIQEMKMLQQLDHPNIIKFCGSWLNKQDKGVVFVTELITSGTLQEFSLDRPVRLNILKKWCKSILNGLEYLHNHEPKIVHRDLKCDNIFINGCTGDLRIGDFGFASHHDVNRSGSRRTSIIETVRPEYLAPELFNDDYDEQVDIYAFGICVLELVAKEVPYSECASSAEVLRKITSGVLPEAFHRMKESPVKLFVRKCIAPVKGGRRPSATELLRDGFLISAPTPEGNTDCLEFMKPELSPLDSSLQPFDNAGENSQPPSPVPVYSPTSTESSGGDEDTCPESTTSRKKAETRSKTEWVCSAKPSETRVGVVDVKLKVDKICICFEFDCSESPKETVQEMVSENCLPSDLPVEDLNTLTEQLERFKTRFSVKRKKVRARSYSSPLTRPEPAVAPPPQLHIGDKPSEVNKPRRRPEFTKASSSQALLREEPDLSRQGKKDKQRETARLKLEKKKKLLRQRTQAELPLLERKLESFLFIDPKPLPGKSITPPPEVVMNRVVSVNSGEACSASGRQHTRRHTLTSFPPSSVHPVL